MGNVTRSRSYPSIDLKLAVAKLGSFSANLGKGFHSREEAVIGMGYRGLSGASARAVAALVQYGLLERKKDSYGLSRLGHSIAFPTSAESQQALKQAAMKPSLFAEVIEQYRGQALPEPKFLANVLTMPKYGINPKQKDEVVGILVASFDFAGLLKEGKIDLSQDEEVDGDEKPDDTDEVSEDVGGEGKGAFVSGAVNKFDIILEGGGRATIIAPPNLTSGDKAKLVSAIEHLL